MTVEAHTDSLPASPLVHAAWVQAVRDQVELVEVSSWRGDNAREGAAIAGAWQANVRTDFAGEPTATSGHLPMPSPESVRALAHRWRGGGASRPIVLYTRIAHEMPSATRAWFTLRESGVAGVAVLQGGLPAWEATLAGVAAPAGRASLPGTVIPGPRSIRTDEVLQIAQRGTVLDARPEDAFHGFEEDARTGHVPGALHASVADLLTPEGLLRPPTDIRRWLLAHEAAGGQQVAAYCGGGVTSSLIVFAAALVGQPVDLYVDSWSGWEKVSGLPVEQGVPRARRSRADDDCAR